MSSKRRRASSQAAPVPSTPLLPPKSSPTLLSPAAGPPDLKSSLISRIECIRRDAEHMYAALIKEMESSSARLAKRMKIDLQACTQHMDDVTREWKNFQADSEEDIQEVGVTCTEFINKAQASGTQFKSSLQDILKSAETNLEGLRARYVLT